MMLGATLAPYFFVVIVWVQLIYDLVAEETILWYDWAFVAAITVASLVHLFYKLREGKTKPVVSS